MGTNLTHLMLLSNDRVQRWLPSAEQSQRQYNELTQHERDTDAPDVFPSPHFSSSAFGFMHMAPGPAAAGEREIRRVLRGARCCESRPSGKGGADVDVESKVARMLSERATRYTSKCRWNSARHIPASSSSSSSSYKPKVRSLVDGFEHFFAHLFLSPPTSTPYSEYQVSTLQDICKSAHCLDAYAT